MVAGEEDPIVALELVVFSTLADSLITNQDLITKKEKGDVNDV